MVLRAAYQSDRASQWIAERAKINAVTLPFTVGELVTLGRSSAQGRLARLGAADRRAIERALAYTDLRRQGELPNVGFEAWLDRVMDVDVKEPGDPLEDRRSAQRSLSGHSAMVIP